MDTYADFVQGIAMSYPNSVKLFIEDKVAEYGSPELFAKAISMSFRSVYNWLKGTMPRRSNVVAMAKALNMEPDDIYSYKKRKMIEGPKLLTEGDINSEFKLVPLVKARPICGTGGLETDGDFIGWYSFKLDFLVRKGNPDAMRLFMVQGDSMEPTILKSDMVLIDTDQKHPSTGQIVLARIDDELVLKRVEKKPGIIILKSDNQNYEPIPITADIVDGVEIHGRMVWSCREY